MEDKTPAYEKLFAWQKADEFAHSVYLSTKNFPKDEIFGLTSQLRRAVLSVVLNIVEGHARQSKKEFHQFLKISYGSLAEVEYLLDFANKEGYLNEIDYLELKEKRNTCGKILWKLLNSQT